MIEKTYINSDGLEVFVNWEDHKVIDLYVFTEDLEKDDWMDEDSLQRRRFLKPDEKNKLFRHARTPQKYWDDRKHLFIDSDEPDNHYSLTY